MSKEIQCQIVGRGTPSCLHDSVIYQPDYEGIQTPFQANEPVWRGGRSNRVVGSSLRHSDRIHFDLIESFNTPVFDIKIKTLVSSVDPGSENYTRFDLLRFHENESYYILAFIVYPDNKLAFILRYSDGSNTTINFLNTVFSGTFLNIHFFADGSIITADVNGIVQTGPVKFDTLDGNILSGIIGSDDDLSGSRTSLLSQNYDLEINSLFVPINEGQGTDIHDSIGNIVGNVETTDLDSFWSGRVRNENGLTYSDNRDGVRLDPMPVLHYQDAAENVLPFSSIDDSTNWGVITDFNISNMGPSKVFQAVNAWKHENINSEVGSRSRIGIYPVPINNNIVILELVIENVNTTTTTIGLRNTTVSNWVFSAHFQWDTHLLEHYSGGEPDVMYEEEIFPGIWRLLIQKNVSEDLSADELKFYIYPTGTNISNGQAIIIHHVASYIDNDIETLKKTGPIFTDGAAALTDRTIYQYDGSNFNNQAMALYCEVEPEEFYIIGDFLRFDIPSFFIVDDQNNKVNLPGIEGQINRVGMVVSVDTMAINVDGTWSADGAYSGSLQDFANMVLLFKSVQIPATIRKIMVYHGGSFLELKGKIDELML